MKASFKTVLLSITGSPLFWVAVILGLLTGIVFFSEKLPLMLSNYTIF